MFARKVFPFTLMALLVSLMLSGAVLAANTPTLKFWTFVSDHQEFYEAMNQEFNEKYPEYAFELDATTMPVDQMHDNLLTSIMAGIGAPDIVDINIQFSGVYFKQNPEFFVDLTSLVDPYRDVMHPERMKVYTDPEGHVIGLPTHLGTGVMYYNKPIFDAAGINIDDIQFYDDWIEAGKKIADPSKGLWLTFLQDQLAREFSLWMMQKGGYMINPAGEITVDGPEAVSALQFIHDLVHKYQVARIAPGGDFGDPNSYDMMNRGQIASLPYAQWFVTRFKNFMTDLRGKVVVRPLPLWEPGGYTSATMGGTGTAILNSSEHQEIAKKFLEFAKLSYEGNVKIWTELGFDPPRMDVYDDERLQQPDPFFGGESIMAAVRAGAERLVAEPVWPQYTEIWTALNTEALPNVLAERDTPQEALSKIADRFRE